MTIKKETLNFKKVGYGYLVETNNDGRSEFFKNKQEAKKHGWFGGVKDDVINCYGEYIKKSYVVEELDCACGDDLALRGSPISYELAVAEIQDFFDEGNGEDGVIYTCVLIS